MTEHVFYRVQHKGLSLTTEETVNSVLFDAFTFDFLAYLVDYEYHVISAYK